MCSDGYERHSRPNVLDEGAARAIRAHPGQGTRTILPRVRRSISCRYAARTSVSG
jgi:hypothetical protein